MSAYAYGIRARAGEALSLDQVRTYAPALFADQAHDSRSSRYVYIPTKDIMTTLMNEGFDLVEARQGRVQDDSKRGFAKHMVRFRKQGEVAERRVGDTSFEVCLRSSHDGSSAYEFFAGLFRLVCLNGMVASDGTVSSVHVKHMGNREHILEKVIEGAYEVVDQAPKVLEAPRVWAGIQLSQAEQMALAESARIARLGDADGHVDSPITARQFLHPRRPSDEGNDLWKTFNRIQENAIRGGLSGMSRDEHNRLRRISTREVRGIDGDVKLNRALWTLAERMANLKQAA